MRQANKPDSPDSHSFNLGIYRPRQLWTSGHVLACPVQMRTRRIYAEQKTVRPVIYHYDFRAANSKERRR